MGLLLCYVHESGSRELLELWTSHQNLPGANTLQLPASYLITNNLCPHRSGTRHLLSEGPLAH
jgi:hypothetical protein